VHAADAHQHCVMIAALRSADVSIIRNARFAWHGCLRRCTSLVASEQLPTINVQCVTGRGRCILAIETRLRDPVVIECHLWCLWMALQ
jgi:hypothetical protein